MDLGLDFWFPTRLNSRKSGELVNHFDRPARDPVAFGAVVMLCLIAATLGFAGGERMAGGSFKALVLALMLGGAAIWLTLRYLDARRSAIADASNNDYSIAQDAADRQLRAYVGPQSAHYQLAIHPDGSGALSVSVEMENHGRTPAQDYCNMGGLFGSAMPWQGNQILDLSGPGHVLFPRMKSFIHLALPLRAADVQAFAQGQLGFVVIAAARYRDHRNAERTSRTEFRIHRDSPGMRLESHQGALAVHSGEAD